MSISLNKAMKIRLKKRWAKLTKNRSRFMAA